MNRYLNKRWVHAFIFTIAWAVFPFYGKLEGRQHAIGLLAAYAVTYGIGYVLSAWKNREEFPVSKEVLWMFLLLAADQVSKLLIHHYLEGELVIIPYGVSFLRHENVHHSAITSFLNIPVSRWMMAIIKPVFLILLWFLLKESLQEIDGGAYASLSRILFFSGGIASVLDTVFWGYTLDFIYLKGFFTMDLKDLYISLAFGAFLLLVWNAEEKKKA